MAQNLMLKIRDDIKVKYILNLHLVDDLLDDESIIFEIIKYVIGQSKDDKVNLEDLKFTSKTLKYIFGDKIKDDTFKQKVIISIKNSISDGDIIPKGKSMFLSDKIINEYYRQ